MTLPIELQRLIERCGGTPGAAKHGRFQIDVHNGPWVADVLASAGCGATSDPQNPSRSLWVPVPRNKDESETLSATLQCALQPQALLLDMDGVLADVQHSYRQAMIETAASFGVEVDPVDVAAAKARGGANNDWILTQRMMEDRGTRAALDEVTRRFEATYQGDEQKAGLHELESLLVEVSWLEKIAARLPIGIVTGRPRGDAERFIERFGLGAHLQTVVCMHDAPAKPDPAPVRLAMERLDVERAWMVGDTPDDMRAGVGAGTVAIGVIAPGDDRDTAHASLMNAGAARVLSELTGLEELLP